MMDRIRNAPMTGSFVFSQVRQAPRGHPPIVPMESVNRSLPHRSPLPISVNSDPEGRATEPVRLNAPRPSECPVRAKTVLRRVFNRLALFGVTTKNCKTCRCSVK
ncbi:JM138 [macacine gammaherpesvirus 11]|uniref:JM138 n=2 Tax=macacine gammaherpesvirus 11 TaxID=2560570 RepID=G9JME6_9GAMA|nr:JM138 [Macaca fuscata rhadinovirus]AAT00115.1 JM138 [Macaca fuscata rhadinovirus]AEW87663.1 JM138 [Macaca fuscata rhadinovirus]AEW87833.1 JM138 [Macaca fuscata rhadinovirus]